MVTSVPAGPDFGEMLETEGDSEEQANKKSSMSVVEHQGRPVVKVVAHHRLNYSLLGPDLGRAE